MRRNPPAKWNLPIVIDPPERLCAVVPVPNDVYHIAAFRGAMLALASAYKWTDDIGHNAKNVALVWRDIADNIQLVECTLPTQYRFNDCLLIEFSVDGGETWNTVADVGQCFIHRLPDNAAQNLIFPQGDFSGIGVKRRTSQTSEIFPFYDENDVMQFRMTKDFELSARGVSNTAWNATMGRGMFGFNLRHTPTNAIARIDNTLAGYGWYSQPISANSASFYGNHPSGSPIELMRVVAATDQANSVLTLFPIVRSSGVLSGAAFALRSHAATRVGSSSELLSGQSVDLHQNLASDGATVLSGRDKYAYYFMRTSTGEPSQSDAKTGAIAVDTVNSTLWAKLASGWVELGAQGEPGVIDVNLEVVACDETPTLTLIDGTLNLTLPATTCPPEPVITRFYHKERTRPLPGENDYLEFMLRAEEHVVLPWEIHEGDQIVTTLIDGWWDDNPFGDDPANTPGYQGHEGSGRVMFSGSPGYFPTNALDPLPDEPHLIVITAYNATTAPAFRTLAGSGVLDIVDLHETKKYAWLMPNTKSAYRFGAQHIGVHLYANPCTTLCEEFDFTVDDHDFHIETYGENTFIGGIGCDYGGTYDGANGFKTAFRDNIASCGVYANELAISKVLDTPIYACKARITFTWEGEHTAGTYPMGLWIYYGNGDYASTQNETPQSAGASQTHEFTIDGTIDRIAVLLLESYTEGIDGWIEKIEIFC